MNNTLDMLLVQLRDGPPGAAPPAAELDRVRALVLCDERIPPELREVVFADPAEAAEDAAGLLAVLGIDDLGELLASAVMAEAGAIDAADFADEDDAWAPIGLALREGLVALSDGIEVADAVMRRVPAVDFAWGSVLADAVAAEAGAVELAAPVLAAVGVAADRGALAVAVLAEAGEIDVADAVLAALRIETVVVRVADAVRAEAGAVDVAPAVMRIVAPTVSGRLPAPANESRGWSWAGVAMAAVALVAVAVGRLATP
ncbi:MAG: hypothetical protein ABMB14_35340, partial [Myxococcota bacterium]